MGPCDVPVQVNLIGLVAVTHPLHVLLGDVGQLLSRKLLQPSQHTSRRNGIVMMDGFHDLIVIEPDLTDLEMQIAQVCAKILRRGIGLYAPELLPEKPEEDESGFVVRTSRLLQHVQKPFVPSLVEPEIVVIPA